MNIVILILLCVLAYALNELMSWADVKITELEERNYIKRYLNNDLNRFKVKKVLNEAKSHCLRCGFSREQAEQQAIDYVNEVIANGQIDNKYQLLKARA